MKVLKRSSNRASTSRTRWRSTSRNENATSYSNCLTLSDLLCACRNVHAGDTIKAPRLYSTCARGAAGKQGWHGCWRKGNLRERLFGRGRAELEPSVRIRRALPEPARVEHADASGERYAVARQDVELKR